MYENIKFLPVPVRDSSKEHYQKFDQIYASVSTEKDGKTLKIQVSKLMKDLIFVISRGYSKYSICSFFTCYTARKFLYFLLNTLLQLLQKSAVEMKLFNKSLVVCKRILNIYEIPHIYDSFSNFLSVHQNL